MPKPKTFISGTTRDLKSYRDVVTDWAHEQGYEPVVQEDFSVQSDYATVVQMLRKQDRSLRCSDPSGRAVIRFRTHEST